MVDNNSNIIKPVESLQNITGLTPTRRREQRKRRENSHQENKKESEQELNEPVEEQNPGSEPTANGNDQPTIDYHA